MAKTRTLFSALAISALALGLAEPGVAAPRHAPALRQAAAPESTRCDTAAWPAAPRATAGRAAPPPRQVAQAQQAADPTYSAPGTPLRMIPGDEHPVKVELRNTTAATWPKATHVLSYHWVLPNGDDETGPSNRLETALPADLAPGQVVTLDARVKAPPTADVGNKREQWVLKWDVLDTRTRKWLSETAGVPTLDQATTVEDPTSDQLGLEKFYQYRGIPTGAGTSLAVNQFSGNAVFGHNVFTNPGRGLATFTRLTYNSLDTSNSYAGRGWSVSTSSLARLGTPLQFDGLLGSVLTGHPDRITLVDGDGTGHEFELNKHDSNDTGRWTYDSPAGVHLLLRRDPGGDDARRWVFTAPDRTRTYFDADGYQTATVDKNGNELLFGYERGVIGNRATKLLTHLTDATGRRTLTLDYYQPGDDYSVFRGNTKVREKGLAISAIVNQLRSVTDVSGRTVTFTYGDDGLLQEVVDGAGTPDAKPFTFFYEDSLRTQNPKLTRVVDPNGGASEVQYYTDGAEELREWHVRTLLDRQDGGTGFDYADADGDSGSKITSKVTDANGNATDHVVDGYGRVEKLTNAKGETTDLTWDADNNVVALREDNGATTTWSYDQKTGFPLEVRDAEGNARGYPGTRLAYRTDLDGHVADLVEKTSPEGRKWRFTYDDRGNLVAVTDPKGTATPDDSDYTARYVYDDLGHLTSTTDANGHTTTYADYDVNGYPQRITDPLNCSSFFRYDDVGNVVSTVDAKGSTSTFTYDVFKRPLDSRVPKDAAANVFITTPGPVYDRNDNVVKVTAANGAVTTTAYDELDRQVAVTSPKDDTPGAPEKTSTFAYDRVGNLLRQTLPKGTLTPEPDDFTVTFRYDELGQAVEATNAEGKRAVMTYDRVGNVLTEADPRKTATSDPNDVTARYRYDLNHRVVETFDASGESVTSTYDRDGNVVEKTDEDGNATSTTYDERSMPVEVRSPHDGGGGSITYFTTRYEYDQVGNTTRTITPRGVQTGDDPDDFARGAVYDELNRVKEELLPFDRDDSSVTAADRIFHSYDEVGNPKEISAPPSNGQSVRNTTRYTYFDNGWTRSSTDAWGISTEYDYNAIGQQTNRTHLSEGGGASRVQTWTYHPDGKKKTRSDGGVPVGRHVVVVDNSDPDDTEVSGTWATVSDRGEYEGFDYRTHQTGGGADSFTWKADIPAGGRYEVAVRYTEATATDASYTVEHDGGVATVKVDQTTRQGEWVPLGTWDFTEDTERKVVLSGAAGGSVTADAVRLARDNSGDVDTEEKRFEYVYDANDNQTLLKDLSSGALVDEYSITYDGLDRADVVEERESGAVKKRTSFDYDENGNVLDWEHDDQSASYSYDVRDLVSKVVNRGTGGEKVTTFEYTSRAHLAKQTKHNGNTVEFEYYLDGLSKRQVERKSSGAVINEHRLEYDHNGNRTRDQATKQNADDKGDTQDNVFAYTFDPRDRVRKVEKTGDDTATETYDHDANNNVVKQTIDDTTTTFSHDRNRLVSATANDVTSSYAYDPWGRLSRVTAAGQQVEKYVYDGFDHTAEHRAGSGEATRTTKYVYDPLDRTVSQNSTGGGAEAKKVEMFYLGLSEQVLTENLNGELNKSYQYSPHGELLSQVSVEDDGTEKDSYFAFNPHSDVESVTDESGDATSTYGYTAYGQDDEASFTGEDKPGQQQPAEEPLNSYRFNTKRFDSASGNYDMGFRDYNPSQNRFLSLDLYNGALSDLGLATNPFTMNRYAFGGGNPITAVEIDGHLFGLSWSDIGHAALDVVGLVPVVGEAADLANAAWYAAEGNYVDAALSAASAIPFAGYGATAVKAGKYADKAVDAVQTADNVGDAAKTAAKVDPPAAPKADPAPAPAPKADPAPAPKAEAPAPKADAPAPKRDPIFADTDLMVKANKGHAGALAEIRGGKTYVTPNQHREFLAGGAGRREFMEREGIELFGGPQAGQVAGTERFQSTFASVNPAQGRGDAALCAFACATGYQAVTMERRLFNFVTKTLKNSPIPIRRVMP
ncbi:RHS repeat-associated core domain-containing protein [Umezawaea sp.]|uniref:golvesin C-terminal-like domain-containing protein n=1 Tax=Umezawaea sp. TaxID=1955258 RepID=UPI002ED34931